MISIDTLYQTVQRPTDSVILSIIREYLKLAPEELGRINGVSRTLSSVLYSHLRNDSNSYGQINIEAKKELIDKAHNDLLDKVMEMSEEERPQNIPDPIQRQPGFMTFQSWKLLVGDKLHNEEIAHRFYININADSIMQLSSILYDKYREYNIPFYFKIHEEKNQGFKDGIVVYTSTKLLGKNLELLGEIEKGHPELIQRCNQPNLLVGNINGWLGYANEFINSNDSYTSIMCNCIAEGLKRSLENWISSNPNQKIDNINIGDYYNVEAPEKYIRMQRIISLLPKIDNQFKLNTLALIKEQLQQRNIDLSNIFFNNEVKKELEIKTATLESLLAKNITLKDGTKLTGQQYIDRYDVVNQIPLNATVTLKNGLVMTGRDFIIGALTKADKFYNFYDLANKFVDTIDDDGNYTSSQQPREKDLQINTEDTTEKKNGLHENPHSTSDSSLSM